MGQEASTQSNDAFSNLFSTIEDGGARVNGKFWELTETYDSTVKTMYDSFQLAVERHPDKPLFGKKGEGGKFEFESYSVVNERCSCVGSGLIKMGLKSKKSGLGFIGSSCVEVAILAQSCNLYSIPCAAFYQNQTDDVLVKLCGLGKVDTLVVDKVNPLLIKRMKNIKHVIQMEEITKEDKQTASKLNIKLHTFKEVEELGKENKIDHIEPGPEDVVTFFQTSSKDPKLVVVKHKALLSQVSSIALEFWLSQATKEEVMLSSLPLAYFVERIMHEAMYITGSAIVFGTKGDVWNDMNLLRPTVFNTVPNVLRDFLKMLRQELESQNYLVSSTIMQHALESKKSYIRTGEGYTHSLYDRLYFSNLQKKVGGRVKAVVCSGGFVDIESSEELSAYLGCRITEVYGMAEAGCCSVSTMLHPIGAGPPSSCCKMKLTSFIEGVELGEIRVKGTGVCEEYADNKKIVDEDGWFFTEDVGRFLLNGTLKIEDKKCNVFVNEKIKEEKAIYLGRLTSLYSWGNKWISQMYINASESGQLVAIIVPDSLAIKTYSKELSSIFGLETAPTMDALMKNEGFNKMMLESLQGTANDHSLSEGCRIGKVYFEKHAFEEFEGLVNPLGFIRRQSCGEYFKALLNNAMAEWKKKEAEMEKLMKEKEERAKKEIEERERMEEEKRKKEEKEREKLQQEEEKRRKDEEEEFALIARRENDRKVLETSEAKELPKISPRSRQAPSTKLDLGKVSKSDQSSSPRSPKSGNNSPRSPTSVSPREGQSVYLGVYTAEEEDLLKNSDSSDRKSRARTSSINKEPPRPPRRGTLGRKAGSEVLKAAKKDEEEGDKKSPRRGTVSRKASAEVLKEMKEEETTEEKRPPRKASLGRKAGLEMLKNKVASVATFTEAVAGVDEEKKADFKKEPEKIPDLSRRSKSTSSVARRAVSPGSTSPRSKLSDSTAAALAARRAKVLSPREESKTSPKTSPSSSPRVSKDDDTQPSLVMKAVKETVPEKTVKCKECGFENAEDAERCNSCSTVLSKEEPEMSRREKIMARIQERKTTGTRPRSMSDSSDAIGPQFTPKLARNSEFERKGSASTVGRAGGRGSSLSSSPRESTSAGRGNAMLKSAKSPTVSPRTSGVGRGSVTTTVTTRTSSGRGSATLKSSSETAASARRSNVLQEARAETHDGLPSAVGRGRAAIVAKEKSKERISAKVEDIKRSRTSSLGTGTGRGRGIVKTEEEPSTTTAGRQSRTSSLLRSRSSTATAKDEEDNPPVMDRRSRTSSLGVGSGRGRGIVVTEQALAEEELPPGKANISPRYAALAAKNSRANLSISSNATTPAVAGRGRGKTSPRDDKSPREDK